MAMNNWKQLDGTFSKNLSAIKRAQKNARGLKRSGVLVRGKRVVGDTDKSGFRRYSREDKARTYTPAPVFRPRG